MATIDLKALLGVPIKTQRASSGDLAGRTGVSRRCSSRLCFRRESGARNPSVQSIEELARALEISVAMLFEHAGMESCWWKTTRATFISSAKQGTTIDVSLPLVLRREWAGRIGDK
jgi:transcriptional regulator with XRE-family HTH domain